MLKKTLTGVFTVISVVAVLQVAGTVILARNLTKADMGQWRLLLTIVELGILVCTAGLDASVVKFFSSPGVKIGDYNWKGFIPKMALISLLLGLAVSFTASWVYRLSLPLTFSILTLLVVLAMVLFLSSFLRAQQQYKQAIFLNRMNFLVFFILLIGLLAVHTISFSTVLLCYILSALIAASVLMYYTHLYVPAGNKPVPSSLFKHGAYYFGLGITLIFIIQAPYLFIGKMLTLRDLAVYAVIASVMRMYEFIQDTLYYVLAPHLNTKKNIPVTKSLLYLLLIGLAVTLVYVTIGKFIVHLFFGGMYDEGLYLMPYFIGIGIVRTLYILPASILGGRTSTRTLRSQLYLSSCAALVNASLIFFFIKAWGLAGAAAASLISWIFFFLITFMGTKKHMHSTQETYAINS